MKEILTKKIEEEVREILRTHFNYNAIVFNSATQSLLTLFQEKMEEAKKEGERKIVNGFYNMVRKTIKHHKPLLNSEK